MIYQVFLGLTYNCNLKCLHCYAKNLKYNKEIPFQKIKSLIDELFSIGVVKIVLSHGEPFLYKKIFEVLDYLEYKNFYTTIMTNGILLDKTVINKLKKYKFIKIYVSFDGIKKETYEKLRGKIGIFNTLKKNIILLKHSNLNWGISTTISKINKNELDEIFNFAIHNGNKDINLLTIRNNGSFEGMLNSIELKKIISVLWIKYNNKIKINIHDRLLNFYLGNIVKNKKESLQIRENSKCVAGKDWISIRPDGDVYSCIFSNIHIGNIYKNNIFTIIKNNNTFIDSPCIKHKINNPGVIK